MYRVLGIYAVLGRILTACPSLNSLDRFVQQFSFGYVRYWS